MLPRSLNIAICCFTLASAVLIDGLVLKVNANPFPADAIAQVGVDQLAGTWQVNLAGQVVTMVITPEGRIYAMVQRPDGTTEAFEMGRVTQKLSPSSSLPPGIKVTSLDDRFAEQVTRAKQSEAKQYVGSMNRAQQAHYLERDRFTASLDELGLGIKPETENYRYRSTLMNIPRSAAVPPSRSRAVMNIGIAKQPGLKSYVGVVWVTITHPDLTTMAILCESNQPIARSPTQPAFQPNRSGGMTATCPTGYSPLGR